MTYRIKITADAKAVILEQARYIANDRHAPLNAARWLSEVYKAADSLEHWPRRCRRAPEDRFRDFEIRKRVVKGFTLLFTIVEDTKTVWIIGARGSGQLPKIDELPGQPPGDEKQGL